MNRADPPAYRITAGDPRAPFVFTCEHASALIPAEYDLLGLRTEQLLDHIGWDIGAAELGRSLARHFNAALIESGYSRLLIDCNRRLDDHDLIVEESHGVVVPGNQRLDGAERARRIAAFYTPYHEAVDRILDAQGDDSILVSVHSFTPETRGERRDFDIGVLYDDYEELATRTVDTLAAQGFRVRHNEPYSGFAGLIFSARTHGRRRGLCYLELEINNARLHLSSDAAAVAAGLAAGLRELLGRTSATGGRPA